MYGHDYRSFGLTSLLSLTCLAGLLANAGCQPPPVAPSATETTGQLHSPDSPQSPPAFKYTLYSQDAELTTVQAGQTAIIQITSDSGIGRADVEIVSGDYPRQISLQFHLSGLERLRFAYATTLIELSLSAGDAALPHETVTHDNGSAQLIAADSPYWLNARSVSAEQLGGTPAGYIEVDLPPAFLSAQARRFSIEWIDFFR